MDDDSGGGGRRGRGRGVSWGRRGKGPEVLRGTEPGLLPSGYDGLNGIKCIANIVPEEKNPGLGSSRNMS